MKYIFGFLHGHLKMTETAYRFFGGDIFGLFGAIGLQMALMFRGLLFVLMAWLSFYGFKEMTGENFWVAFGGFATLATGLAALVAAKMSIKTIQDQIDQQKNIEKNRVIRRHISERSVMPLALSEIARFSREFSEVLVTRLNAVSNSDDGRRRTRVNTTLTLPLFDDRIINNIKLLIETSDDNGLNSFLIEIIAQLQVLESRFEEFRVGAVATDTMQLVGGIALSAWIYQVCSSLFAYARFETEDLVPPSESDLVGHSIRRIAVAAHNQMAIENLNVLRRQFLRKLQSQVISPCAIV